MPREVPLSVATGYNGSMADQKSPATDVDPSLLDSAKVIVRGVLRHKSADVHLPGSRARGTQRRTSEIDVAIEAMGPTSEVVALAHEW